MTVNIQAIHFEIADRLTDFINKKATRFSRHYPDATDFEVILKVIKPETAMNKEATVKVKQPQSAESVASKTADTFEEAVDLCIEALERQLEKVKGKK